MRPILVDPKTGPPRLVIDGPGRRTGSWGWLLRCQPFEGTHGVPPGRALQTTPRRKKVALLVAEKRRHVERLVPGALEAAGSGRRDGRLARDLAPSPSTLRAEAGGDHGHSDLVAHRVVDHRAEDD